jgi:hypothetical protein
MNPLSHLAANSILDLNESEKTDEKIGFRYPVSYSHRPESAPNDLVEVYVRDYSLESDCSVSSKVIYDALSMWLLYDGLRPLTEFTKACTSSHVSRPDKADRIVLHPDVGQIQLKIKFNYIWGDAR